MVSETLVKARKAHRCEEYGDGHLIRPGDDYVRCVAFPDGDVNTGTQPWVLRICVDHFQKYGKVLPPRPRRRTRQEAL